MKIEAEIKQVAFENEIQKLIVNQLFTGKYVSNIIAQHLKPFGLSSQQYNVLRILRGQQQNAISVNAIATRMIDKMSNVSRLIDKLDDKKLIKRKVNKKDRRQIDVSISNNGIQLLAKIDAVEKKMQHHFNHLTIKEAEQLNLLLDKLRG